MLQALVAFWRRWRRNVKRPRSRSARLGFEILEQREVPATASGTVTGTAFLDVAGSGILTAADTSLPGIPVTLTGSTSQNAPVNATAVTDLNGKFTIDNVLPGTYQLQAGTVPALLGSVLLGGVSAPAGVTVVQQPASVPGGTQPQFVCLANFLTNSTPADSPFGAGGSGTAVANYRPNNTPTIASTLGTLTILSNGAPTNIDLAGAFTDPDFTNSRITLNTTDGAIHLNLHDTTAPQNVANFFDYINAGKYNNVVFNRLASGFVLQGGGITLDPSGNSFSAVTPFAAVPGEAKASNSNTANTLAMALGGSDPNNPGNPDPNSGTDQFFFNLVNNSSSLDAQKFTAFGDISDPASRLVLAALGATPTKDESTSPAAAAFPNVLGGAFGATTFPLNGYNDTPANFPATASASNFITINSITIDNRDEFLTYQVSVNVTSGPSNLVVASLENEHLTLSYPSGGVGSATVKVTATDRFGASLDQTFTVNVTPGAVSLASSSVAVNPDSIQSGSASTITLTAKDANGNQETSGGLTVAFGLGNGSANGTFGAVTDNHDGTYTATFTGTTAGTNTITATIGGQPVTSTLPSITVTPGAVDPTQTAVSTSPAAIVTGGTTTVTLTAKDANGNPLTTGGSTVVFSLGAGSAGGTLSPVTDNSNGAYTATFTGAVAGTDTITATIDGQAVASAPTVVVVGPVEPSQSTIQVVATSIQSGASTLVVLTAKDANGNQEPVGGSTVAFSLGTGTADGTFSAVTDHGNGTYSANFTGTIAGTSTVTATIDGQPVTSTLPSVVVTPGPVDLSQSLVTINPTSISTGDTTTVTLTAKDAAGNQETSGGLIVAFGLGAGSADGSFSGVTDNHDGTYTATFTGTVAGSNTVTATIGGHAVTSAAPTVVVFGAIDPAQTAVATDPAAIVVGGTTTVTLTAKDSLGNVNTTGGSTVVFSLGAGSAGGTLSAVTDNGDGTYTATFTGTIAGDDTITATIDGQAVASAPTVVVVGPVDPSQTTIQVVDTAITAGASTEVVLTAKDANGNQEPIGGSTVVFGLGAGSAGGAFSAVTDNGDGTYTAIFTSTTAGTDTITASIDGQAVTSTSPTITVT